MQTVLDRQGRSVTPPPNWRSGVKETFEYKTEIFEAEDGTETRFSHRMMPRWSVQYRADVVGARRLQTMRDLWDNDTSDRWYVVPVRWRGLILRDAISASATSATFDGELPWWAQDDMYLVFEDSTQSDTTIITSASQGSGEFTINFEAVNVGFAAGSRVMLGLRTFYEQQSSLSRQINSHMGFQPTFLADPARLPELQPPAFAGDTHESIPLFNPRHNWSSAHEIEIDDRRETVDYGRGVIDRTWYHDHQYLSETRRFTGMGQTQVEELVHNFMRQRGMREPFWAEWLEDDLPEHNTVSAGFSAMTFQGPVLRDWLLQDGVEDPVLNHLWVEWPDGQVQVNGFTNVGNSAGNDYLTMRDTWVRDIDADTKVRLAILARFGSDRLELDWQTAEVATAQVPLRALRTDWIYA